MFLAIRRRLATQLADVELAHRSRLWNDLSRGHLLRSERACAHRLAQCVFRRRRQPSRPYRRGTSAPAPRRISSRRCARRQRISSSTERDVTAVIAQEDYLQRIPTEARTRRLRSDLLIIAEAHVGWVELRDTFEVDESPVRDRDERIAKLFMKPNPDALQQARRIAKRRRPLQRQPDTIPAQPDAQRSDDRAQVSTRTESASVDLSAGSRRAVPRRPQIQGAGDAAADRVRRPRCRERHPSPSNRPRAESSGSEFVAGDRGVSSASSRVVYARSSRALKLWLPASMTESYQPLAGPKLEMDGRATYSNFRMFRRGDVD